jgi:hypothetical protein
MSDIKAGAFTAHQINKVCAKRRLAPTASARISRGSIYKLIAEGTIEGSERIVR